MTTQDSPDEMLRLLEGRVGVSRETLARLTIFERLLREWSARIDLIGPREMQQFWTRHAADSLQLLDSGLGLSFIGAPVDLGSGAGFPGLVLACALAEQDLQIRLVEKNLKRCAFLRAVIRETGAAALVLQQNLEQPTLPAAGLGMARALAPLPTLCGMMIPWLEPQGTFVALKGANAALEAKQAATEWAFDAELTPSLTDPNARIVVLRHLRPRMADAE